MIAERNPVRHDRESVTDTALRLLDEVGLPDLSMRRLATELGVQPSALYWHFENKQALLAAVADRILVRVDSGATATATASATASTPEQIFAAAREIRDALFTYRDGAEVVMSTYALGWGGGRAHSRLADALRIHTGEAEAAATVLLQFILGHALLVQQRLHAESHGAAAPSEETDSSADLDETFDIGVCIFVRGVVATVKSPSEV